MMAQCTAHIQLKSVYGVSRITCHRTPGPLIFMSKVRGPGVEVPQKVPWEVPWTVQWMRCQGLAGAAGQS